MNHAGHAVASGFLKGAARLVRGRAHLVSGAAFGIALAVQVFAAVPVTAQVSMGDLPAPELDPQSNPFPFDGQRVIREYLKGVLPLRWWANEPEFSFGSFSVTIHVPEDWKGNPSSAMMRFCPPSYSPLWGKISSIELVPFYRDARRSSYTCRKW